MSINLTISKHTKNVAPTSMRKRSLQEHPQNHLFPQVMLKTCGKQKYFTKRQTFIKMLTTTLFVENKKVHPSPKA